MSFCTSVDSERVLAPGPLCNTRRTSQHYRSAEQSKPSAPAGDDEHVPQLFMIEMAQSGVRLYPQPATELRERLARARRCRRRCGGNKREGRLEARADEDVVRPARAKAISSSGTVVIGGTDVTVSISSLPSSATRISACGAILCAPTVSGTFVDRPCRRSLRLQVRIVMASS